MQTVDKALRLLNLFSVTQPEIGLSELARLAGFDKAATRRFLVALQKHHFIEQNPATKAYRLGTGFLHLAKIREATFPLDVIVQTALDRLTATTGETAHACLIIDGNLSTIAVTFPPKANRVHLDMGEKLPLHATASGQAWLAFAAGDIEHYLPNKLSAFTTQTQTSLMALRESVCQAAERGYGMVANGYENEVTGTAVPFFNAQAQPIGTLAVATPSARMTSELQTTISRALLQESRLVTVALGGQLPSLFSALLQEAAA